MGKLVEAAISDEKKDRENLFIPFPELLNKYGWDWVAKNRTLSSEFIEEWIYNFNITDLLENQNLSKELLSKMRDLFHYKLSSKNKSHIFLDVDPREFRSKLRESILHIRQNSFIEGTVKYKIVFYGELAKEVYSKVFYNYKFNIKTSDFYKRIKVEMSCVDKKGSYIAIYNEEFNNALMKIYVI